jgi:hypothetical protein
MSTRRKFILGALGLGAFSTFGGFRALVFGAAAPAPPAAAPKPPEISDEARALHGVLVARWASGLDEKQKQGLLEAIENNVQSGKALRAKSLYNGQEPATFFRVTPPAPR